MMLLTYHLDKTPQMWEDFQHHFWPATFPKHPEKKKYIYINQTHNTNNKQKINFGTTARAAARKSTWGHSDIINEACTYFISPVHSKARNFEFWHCRKRLPRLCSLLPAVTGSQTNVPSGTRTGWPWFRTQSARSIWTRQAVTTARSNEVTMAMNGTLDIIQNWWTFFLFVYIFLVCFTNSLVIVKCCTYSKCSQAVKSKQNYQDR